MVDSSNITVTDHRLKQAIVHANTVSQADKISELEEKLDTDYKVNIGRVKRWYVGLDYALVDVNGNDVKAHINHLFVNNDMIISILPEGVEEEDVDGYYYIRPVTDLYVNILSYTSDSKVDYCIIGYTNIYGKTKESASSGEILLQNGDSKISIKKERINIMSDNLFINGINNDNTSLSDYYTKEEVDKMIEAIWEVIEE